jgi:uncharacterized protein GlcG (DUF336 family)
MQVSLKQAQAVVDAAEEKARSLGVAVNIAVVDAGCFLKAFRRMDGAMLGTIDLALGKAKTAALFFCSTKDVWENAKPGGPFPGLERSNGGLVTFAGGMLLKAPDGEIIGALGVSGGAVAEDTAIADAGVAGLPTEIQ